jgi:hypothetical protein
MHIYSSTLKVVSFEVFMAVIVTHGLMSCDTVWSSRCILTFQKNMLPPSSGMKHVGPRIGFIIQSVPGGKVNILEGHSIGHQDTAISLYSSKIVDKKEILRTVSNTGIYCSSEKVGTVYLV